MGSRNVADKVASVLMGLATDKLRRKALYTQNELKKIYIDRGFAKNKLNRKDDGNKAKDIYDQLPEYEKDFHDLDLINELLNLK
jgi:hypothetical protein